MSAQPIQDVVAPASDSVVVREPRCELERVEQMLHAYCGDCHYKERFGVPIDCLGDCTPIPVKLASIIEAGLVVPGDAQGSELLRRLRDNSMPPTSSMLEPLSEQQVAQLAAFVAALEPDAKLVCEPASDSSSD